MNSQPSHLSYTILYNNYNLVSHNSDSPTVVLPNNTTVSASNDSALLYNLHSAPLSSKKIQTAADNTEKQIGNSSTDSSNEVSITPADSSFVTGENTKDVNREISYVDNFDNYNTIATSSKAPTKDNRFVSNPKDQNERQMVTCSQKGIFKPNPKYALTAIHAYLNEHET